jgi:hypothetical protein
MSWESHPPSCESYPMSWGTSSAKVWRPAAELGKSSAELGRPAAELGRAAAELARPVAIVGEPGGEVEKGCGRIGAVCRDAGSVGAEHFDGVDSRGEPRRDTRRSDR